MQETGIYGTIILGGLSPKRRSLMYLDFLVKIPFVQGKITRRKKKGMKDFIRGIIEENQGGFENSRGKYVDRYDVYGMIVKRFLCEGETKKRNFHIYYSDGKA